MIDWDLRLQTTRLDFVDRLERRGFARVTNNIWHGSVRTPAGRAREIEVCLGEDWPYYPPTVFPLNADVASSWHRDRTGALCLYVEDDRGERPWLDVEALLAHVAGWFDQAETNWSDDTPDLDLERYFDAARPRLLVVYDDLEPLLNRSIRTKKGFNDTLVIIGAGPVARKAQRRNFRFGYCADIGTPDRPPKQWSDLEPLIRDGSKVAEGIRRGSYRLLLLRYSRAGRVGVLALAAHGTQDEIVLRAHNSAGTSAAVRGLRAGPHAPALATKGVAIVGCGAVGSFVAEGLARAGVGILTLQDGDILRPGNLVRHLATEREVGLVKPEAVRQSLGVRGLLPRTCSTINRPLLGQSGARDLVSRHDLVVDASADGAVTTLLRHAAEEAGKVVLTVCTQNDGDSIRVDILPPLAGSRPLAVTIQREPRQPEVYEGGCGDPVSPTPPYAVAEAAALAVRHACAIVLATPLVNNGELHEYPLSRDG